MATLPPETAWLLHDKCSHRNSGAHTHTHTHTTPHRHTHTHAHTHTHTQTHTHRHTHTRTHTHTHTRERKMRGGRERGEEERISRRRRGAYGKVLDGPLVSHTPASLIELALTARRRASVGDPSLLLSLAAAAAAAPGSRHT